MPGPRTARMAYLGPAHHIAYFDKVKRAKTTLRSTSCAMCDTGGHRDESEVWQGFALLNLHSTCAEPGHAGHLRSWLRFCLRAQRADTPRLCPLFGLTRSRVIVYSEEIVKVIEATDADEYERLTALSWLGMLPPVQLEPHAKQVVRVLEQDPSLCYHLLVQYQCSLPFNALAQLPPEELTRHVPSLLIMLDDGISEIWRVRALEVLSLLPESALLPHAARIAQHIEDRPDRAKLDRPTLCEQDEDPQLNPSNGICFDHSARPTLCEQYEDPQLNPWNGICFDHSAYPMWVDERVAALRVMKQLPEQVGLRTASIVSLLGNYDWKLRVAAAEALAALPATHGANTAAAILPLLNHLAWEVRHAALRALRHFAARDLAPHAPAIEKLVLLDPHEDVRAAAQGVLSSLDTSSGATTSLSTHKMLSPPLPKPAHSQDWAYWQRLVVLNGAQFVLSEHADEFLRVLQQRAGWQFISAVAERCYQDGAKQVLLMLGSDMPPAWHLISDPDYGDCVCLSVVSEGLIPDQDKLTAVIGKQVFLERFPLLHSFEADAIAQCEADSFYGVLTTIWITRSGEPKPARDLLLPFTKADGSCFRYYVNLNANCGEWGDVFQ